MKDVTIIAIDDSQRPMMPMVRLDLSGESWRCTACGDASTTPGNGRHAVVDASMFWQNAEHLAAGATAAAALREMGWEPVPPSMPIHSAVATRNPPLRALQQNLDDMRAMHLLLADDVPETHQHALLLAAWAARHGVCVPKVAA